MTERQRGSDDDRDEGPWYKQFWAWFVFAPLLAVMLAWIPFMTIALKEADDLVIDNYYKEGRMYNLRLDEDRRATALGLRGKLFIDLEVGEVVLTVLSGDSSYRLPAQLQLQLDHPVEEDNDVSLQLTQIYPGRYLGQLQHSIANRWYVRLSPLADAADVWRITGELDLSRGTQMQFGEHE